MSEVKQNNGWISVKKRLPKIDNHVLVYAPNCNIIGPVLVGVYFPSEDTWTVYDFGESKLNEKVTHWMYLPNDPSGNPVGLIK